MSSKRAREALHEIVKEIEEHRYGNDDSVNAVVATLDKVQEIARKALA